jgi:CubicO group peptidase (beta-lactamase class C family)
MPSLPLAELDSLFAEALNQGVFPGAVFGIACGPPSARQTVIKAYGRLWASECQGQGNPVMDEAVVFDLASLTKPLATVLALLIHKQRGLLRLDDRLPDLLGQVVPADKGAITLAHLLRHSSGLPAHRPYFEILRTLPVDRRREVLLELLLDEPLEARPGDKAVYSDLGFILLGRIVEEISGETLDSFVNRWLYGPLGLEGKIAFNPLYLPVFGEGTVFAPTEECPWRGRVLQGEVHDDNAHAMGGVAGHAGLFAPAGAVLTLVSFLLDLVKGRAAHPHLPAADLQEAVRCTNTPADSTWGLGFDTPSAVNPSAGELLSRLSFGHLGFTGTSFWCDPERDLSVVLLSNRVHLGRLNTLIRAFRPRFHDAVARACDQAWGRF